MLEIRCLAKTEPGVYRHMLVNDKGVVLCDCGGSMFCSHIDAVIVAGEIAMVHPLDMDAARKAHELFADLHHAPPSWSASWRKNLRWRGFEVQDRSGWRQLDRTRPVVCFTGKATDGRERKYYKAEAEAAGWTVADKANIHTQLLVTDDVNSTSRKAKLARRDNVPMASYDDWPLFRDSPPAPHPAA